MYLHFNHERAALIFDRTLDRIDGAFKAFNSRVLYNKKRSRPMK
jgi:hypothetical protein